MGEGYDYGQGERRCSYRRRFISDPGSAVKTELLDQLELNPRAFCCTAIAPFLDLYGSIEAGNRDRSLTPM